MSGYRTIIALLVALLGELLKLAGIEISAADQDGLVNTIMVLGGIAAAIWYRIDAKRKLRGNGKLA